MIGQSRNILLIHRGPEYARDFEAIAEKLHALGSGISLHAVAGNARIRLPASFWQSPTLTVALTPDFKLDIPRGPVLKNHPIEKLAQQDIFRAHGVPTPPALPFRFGMRLDPILFGGRVVLKPASLNQTSKGDGFYLFETNRIPLLRPSDFAAGKGTSPANSRYLVQAFVDTGTRISVVRVTTFLGKILSCWTARAIKDAPSGSAVAVQSVERERVMLDDEVYLGIGRKVAAAMPSIPLLGIDIVRDCRSGKCFVLECNAGGNTWLFSSPIAKGVRASMKSGPDDNLPVNEEKGRQRLIAQFSAFDRAAEALAETAMRMAG